MLHIDLKKAQELVAESIAERGEGFVYEKEEDDRWASCKYVHGVERIFDVENEVYVDNCSEGTPGCLVGLALNKAGITMEALIYGDRNESAAEDLLAALAGRGLISYSSDAMYYLTDVQSSQDEGASWGEANKAALRGKRLAAAKEYDYNLNRYVKTGAFKEMFGSAERY